MFFYSVNFEIYVDILMTENWMPRIINWINGNEDIRIDSPINDFFDENGFESRLFLKNIGSAIIFLLVYILMWFIVGIMKLVGIWYNK